MFANKPLKQKYINIFGFAWISARDASKTIWYSVYNLDDFARLAIRLDHHMAQQFSRCGNNHRNNNNNKRLPAAAKEKTRLFYPRIRKLPELINTVAANLEEDRRVYGTDPMDVDGRRLRSFSKNLRRYGTTYKNYMDEEETKAFMLKSINKRMLNVFDVVLKENSGLKIKALVDSGSDLDFIDWSTTKRLGIPIKRLYQDKYSIQFYVTTLPTNIPIILGSNWLKKHDPKIGFKDQTIQFDSEYYKKKEEKKNKEEVAKEIINNYKDSLVKLDKENKKDKKHVISLGNKSKCIKKKTCKKSLKNNKVLRKKYMVCLVMKERENSKVLEEVPKEYKEYESVFDEIECNELPPHRIYDCKIKLKDKDNLFYGPLL
ncbi:hypothetical protein PIROE2DRAFT_16792 [Piromyces sp. E2]|nr:hypothetical protein PIROE2DRAFT_16792 [Piromyces sp. E2]|eukprot:OUM58048.1 hypothetical protein PIROE2DRAFT_16792 [Piromyces sp. E2]